MIYNDSCLNQKKTVLVINFQEIDKSYSDLAPGALKIMDLSVRFVNINKLNKHEHFAVLLRWISRK